MRISANPMVDAGGKRLGTVLEWADRTVELGIEAEIKALVQSATSGDLTHRMDLDGKAGVFAEIGPAAKEIKGLIQDSVRKVGEGAQLVTQSGQTLDHIVTAVKKASDIVGEIAGASREQSAGVEQVNKAVVQLDEMTQQNAALVEQASAASQSMADQTRGLSEMLERYQVSAQAAAAAAAQASTRRSASAQNKAAAPAPQAGRSMAPVKAAKKSAVKAVAGGSDDWTEF